MNSPPSSPPSKFLKWIVCGAGRIEEGETKVLSKSKSSGDLEGVPKGCLAVYVGAERERFVIPVSLLKNPHVSQLLQENKDDCSSQFCYQGGLVIPCNTPSFELALKQSYKAGSFPSSKIN